MRTLVFGLGRDVVGKPEGDISLVTDYDQRYLLVISKIFYKEVPSWDDRSGDVLNAVLARGGRIAVYWHKMRLVGAVVWSADGDDWILEHIGFKRKEQRRGHGRVLLDFVRFQIQEAAARDLRPQGMLRAKVAENSPAAAFLEKYGFVWED